MRRAWILLCLPILLGFTCGHGEEEGLYAYTVDQVLHDTCGMIPDAGNFATGTLTVIGDNVRIDDFTFQGVRLEMVGHFLANSDGFYMDGSASNAALTQPACTADMLQVSVTASSNTATSFAGDVQLNTTALHAPACQCQAEVTYRATKQ